MMPENLQTSSEIYRFLTGNGLMDVGSYGIPSNYHDFAGGIIPAGSSFNGSSSSSFYPFEVSDITEMPQARALAASKNHREAEKRRRERINSHLNKLRSLLPCNSKTDKASLLAKVIQQVKDLKQQTMEISQLELFPSETDEISVHAGDFSGDGRSIMKASLCCEDRSDLLPDLIETLKSLRLKTLRAEMATLGGRVRNVLLVTGEEDEDHGTDESIGFLRDALKTLIDRSNSSDRSKRRRILDRRTITTTSTTTT
ncbi:Myc-type [Macleaya cordata]|uniref:Myc-type n=1 Tax=Macleaya cordata TaxID=56857 RepID=A0A200PUY4_MACCD|nr:Myc-type [Macleaya cordata]